MESVAFFFLWCILTNYFLRIVVSSTVMSFSNNSDSPTECRKTEHRMTEYRMTERQKTEHRMTEHRIGPNAE